ncbi:protein-tyrosine phosphatase-like protein [Lipomyces kononenkoae]|uniref:Protein-tyrosine phosphatase-like protein n=1 Tax=Lipomyces kononenkoae TaxID=34357 RepID=A0ACC3SW21_LIPKO
MINQVENVEMVRRGVHSPGALHLTTHHLIFRENTPSNKEVWVSYPIMAYVERRPFSTFTGFSALRIRCRDFAFLSFNFNNERDSKAVFDTLMALACVPCVDHLYAFYYHPGSAERTVNTWNIYDPIKEFQRMGVGTTIKSWRVTTINKDYEFCPTYPSVLVVPASVADSVLTYAGRYRSKARIPTLSYIHPLNNCTITRCSQPLVGLKQNRSAQDERYIHAIFTTTHVPNTYGASQENLIVDARPTTNAIAQTALGAGSENMENYKFARKVYLGIDNIHVMRESLSKVYEALKDSDITPLPPNRELLYKSGWLKHISTVMEGAVLMGKRIHYYHSHVLVHCSDGWDRTAQLSSLAQIFLDPYFRTIDGFIILVEKEWLACGHRFAERCGHLSSEKSFVQASDKSGTNSSQSAAHQAFSNVMSAAKSAAEKASAGSGGGSSSNGTSLKYTAPIFHQFLDCVYQLLRQFPDRFEYQERFLRRMLYHLYSCQYGTFLYNNEKERVDANASQRTQSVWDYFVVRKKEFVNPRYIPDLDKGDRGADAVIFPDPKNVRWWHEVFGRTEEEMSVVTLNGIGSTATAYAVVQNRRRLQQHQHYQQPPPQKEPRPMPTSPGFTYDSLRDVASSTLSSWASSMAASSNAWANAASPYIASSSAFLSSTTYADAVERPQPHVGELQASPIYRSSHRSAPSLTLSATDSDVSQPTSGTSRSSQSTTTINEPGLEDTQEQAAIEKLAGISLDPLDSYSLTHAGNSDEAYIPETQ